MSFPLQAGLERELMCPVQGNWNFTDEGHTQAVCTKLYKVLFKLPIPTSDEVATGRVDILNSGCT
jgi:hypothetical protein